MRGEDELSLMVRKEGRVERTLVYRVVHEAVSMKGGRRWEGGGIPVEGITTSRGGPAPDATVVKSVTSPSLILERVRPLSLTCL